MGCFFAQQENVRIFGFFCSNGCLFEELLRFLLLGDFIRIRYVAGSIVFFPPELVVVVINCTGEGSETRDDTSRACLINVD